MTLNIVLIVERKWTVPMSKYCPVLKQKVLYLTCLECEDKVCKKENLFVNDKVSDISENNILDKNPQENIITK